jgi:hypothetical protein
MNEVTEVRLVRKKTCKLRRKSKECVPGSAGEPNRLRGDASALQLLVTGVCFEIPQAVCARACRARSARTSRYCETPKLEWQLISCPIRMLKSALSY